MKMKLLGSVVANPADNNIGTAALVHVVATSATTLTQKNSGGTTLGTIYIPAGGDINLVKESTDTITCPTSNCTSIAYIS